MRQSGVNTRKFNLIGVTTSITTTTVYYSSVQIHIRIMYCPSLVIRDFHLVCNGGNKISIDMWQYRKTSLVDIVLKGFPAVMVFNICIFYPCHVNNDFGLSIIKRENIFLLAECSKKREAAWNFSQTLMHPLKKTR